MGFDCLSNTPGNTIFGVVLSLSVICSSMLSDLAAPRDISAGHCENHYTTIHNQLLTLTYRLDKSYSSHGMENYFQTF